MVVGTVKCVTVFCGASAGNDPQFMEEAREIGSLLAEKKIKLIYGGSNAGCMGAIADAALKSGGEVIGVMPEFLASREGAHKNLTEMIIVDSLHVRKQVMADKADVFLALGGGIGTLDELVEILSWRNLKLHKKPVYIYNRDGFFDNLTSLFLKMQTSGFLAVDFSNFFEMVSSPKEFIEKL